MIPIVAGLALGALMGGGIAALQKKDILQGALMGGIGGAVGGAFMPGVAGAALGEGAGAVAGSAGSTAGTAGTSSIFANAPGAGVLANGTPLLSAGTSAVPGAVASGGAAVGSGGIGGFLGANKYALLGGGLGGMMAQAKEPEKQSQGNIYDMSFSQQQNPLFGQPGQAAFTNQGYTTNSITPVEDYKPAQMAANGGIIALAEGGEPGMEMQRYSRPTRTVDPAVTAYNAKLMERANQQYNVNPPPAPNQVPGSVGYIAPPPPQAPTPSADKSISGLTYNPSTGRFEGEFAAPNAKKKFDYDMEQMRPETVNSMAGDSGNANGGLMQSYNMGGISTLGSYSDGGQLLRGPGDGVSDSIPARIGAKQPARLADGEFVIPARIVSEIGNGSTDAGAKQLYAMMDRVQKNRKKTVGKGKVAVDAKSRKLLPA
jgi:hypothetical protein